MKSNHCAMAAWAAACLLIACNSGSDRDTAQAPVVATDAASPFDDDDSAVPGFDTGPEQGPLDRDGDGLSNAYELSHGLNPDDADTDHDGVSDLAEVVAKTDAADATQNPMAHGDFYFISPYAEPPQPARASLVFATSLQATDLFILVDTTGTMGHAIAQLQAKLATSIVPEAKKLVGDLQIGVGSFEDIPNSTYGDKLDSVLDVVQVMTSDTAVAQAGVNALELGWGGDLPEAAVPALHALVTGQGLGAYLNDAPPCPNAGIGYACLRPYAAPIVLLVSDAELHNGPNGENAYGNDIEPAPPAYADAVAALQGIGAHVISVLSYGDGKSAPPADYPAALQLAQLSRDTGAVDASGKPFLFSVGQDATGLDARVIDAVRAVAQQIPVSVSVVVRDDPSDDVDATDLIERVEANTHGGIADPRDASRVCVPAKAEDSDGDGHADTFAAVLPGTPVCFDVVARVNQIVMNGAGPKLYKAFIDVVADHKSVLDTREVYFLVPPAAPILE